MLQAYKNKKIKAFTLPEIIIGATIMAIIFGLFARWFFVNRKYQSTVGNLAEANQNMRRLSYNMAKELRVARLVLYPTAQKDEAKEMIAASDNKLVFKAFNGDIVSYFLSKKEGEKTGKLLRCVIASNKDAGYEKPKLDAKPMAENIDNAVFTNADEGGRYVGIYIESKGVYSIEGVYLLN